MRSFRGDVRKAAQNLESSFVGGQNQGRDHLQNCVLPIAPLALSKRAFNGASKPIEEEMHLIISDFLGVIMLTVGHNVVTML